MRGKEVLQKMTPYQPGKSAEYIKKQYNVEKIVKLASNENPYGYSPVLHEALKDFAYNFEFYPDGYATELRNKLSETLQVNEEQLVFGSGSDELIQIIVRTFLERGQHTIMATPTFPQYRHHALIEGAHITEVPLVNGRHDIGQMLEAITGETKVIWLCTPNNPTGISIAQDEFISFMNQCPSHILVVLDEAYYEFQDSKYDIDAINQLKTYKNLITLRTFSKAYGLAGLRVGYAVTTENIARQLNIVRGPFNTSQLAQMAATIAFEDQKFIEETVSKNKIVKEQFAQFLKTINWEFYPSEANFVLVKTPDSGEHLFNFLIKHGFIVRPGELLGYPNTVRITLGEKGDMATLHLLLQTYNRQMLEE